MRLFLDSGQKKLDFRLKIRMLIIEMVNETKQSRVANITGGNSTSFVDQTFPVDFPQFLFLTGILVVILFISGCGVGSPYYYDSYPMQSYDAGMRYYRELSDSIQPRTCPHY